MQPSINVGEIYAVVYDATQQFKIESISIAADLINYSYPNEPIRGIKTGQLSAVLHEISLGNYVLYQPMMGLKEILDNAEKESKLALEKVPCYHRWKTYTGLTKSFFYCEICDEKQGN